MCGRERLRSWLGKFGVGIRRTSRTGGEAWGSILNIAAGMVRGAAARAAQVCYTALCHARHDRRPPELGSVVGVSARPRCAAVQCSFLRQPSRTTSHTLAERAAGRGRADFPGPGTAARFRATEGLSWQNSKLDPRSGFAAAGARGDLLA